MEIDYQMIGKKIAKERKYYKHVSQERMAADLGMYQADISDLERGKPGSGINDIAKLDMIARYLGISLQELLSDAWQDNSKIRSKHLVALQEMLPDNLDDSNLLILENGAYITYIVEDKTDRTERIISIRSYIFYGDRLISLNCSDICK